MKEFWGNNRGEAHLKTVVIIVAAVLIGGLILGGVYAVFRGRNGVMEQMNEGIDRMINTGNSVQVICEDGRLLYGYGGESWYESTIDHYDESSVVTTFVEQENETSTVYVAVFRDSSERMWCYRTENGMNWVLVTSDSTDLSLIRSGGKLHLSCHDGRSYASSDGINWTMTSTKNY